MIDRVNFLIVGAQRAGTTALHRYLSPHPDLSMSEPKETHHFDKHVPGTVEQYHANWNGHLGIRGEATPSYMFRDDVPVKVCAYNPEMRLIFLLRHPVDRAYSHYMMEVQRKRLTCDFQKAIVMIRVEVKTRKRIGSDLYSYVDRGMYARQVKWWLECFPLEQMLLLKSEDFVADRVATIDKITAFLGVGSMAHLLPNDPPFRSNYPPVSGPIRSRLIRRFAGDMLELESLTGWNLDGWRV